eukprot:g2528.t1
MRAELHNEFHQQVVIVTGAARGLGNAIAHRFAKRGAKSVVLVDINKPALEKASQDFTSNYPKCQAITSLCDVTKEDSVKTLMETVYSECGRIDILVQAAGITGKTGIKTEQVDLKDFERVFRINTTALFLGCKHVLPYMQKRNYGRIVNIASISGKEGNAGMLAYSASKAAVIGLTKVIGKEYAETGITVNALAPAVVQTAMVAALPKSQVKYMTDKIPMKRTGKLDEIASIVAFIASPRNSFCTAFTFDATGGRATY